MGLPALAAPAREATHANSPNTGGGHPDEKITQDNEDRGIRCLAHAGRSCVRRHRRQHNNRRIGSHAYHGGTHNNRRIGSHAYHGGTHNDYGRRRAGDGHVLAHDERPGDSSAGKGCRSVRGGQSRHQDQDHPVCLQRFQGRVTDRPGGRRRPRHSQNGHHLGSGVRRVRRIAAARWRDAGFRDDRRQDIPRAPGNELVERALLRPSSEHEHAGAAVESGSLRLRRRDRTAGNTQGIRGCRL
ncbi:hypothetical protein BMS3Abin02_02222 [bacterium BMS3Abin02]|nr:hypothetical protein BMS3Abin02_02222 [bacterium BMS3Abin02]